MYNRRLGFNWLALYNDNSKYLLVVKFRLVYPIDSRLSNTVYACTWYSAPGIKSRTWVLNELSSIDIVLFVAYESDNPRIYQIKKINYIIS